MLNKMKTTRSYFFAGKKGSQRHKPVTNCKQKSVANSANNI